jgi:hypothetical protein
MDVEQVRFGIRLFSKIILYTIWIYLVYIVIHNLQNKKKKTPTKWIYLGSGILFSVFGFLFLITLLINGVNTGNFLNYAGVVLLISMIFSVLFASLSWWVYFKKKKA